MDRKRLLLSSALIIFMIPFALLATGPKGPATSTQTATAETAGGSASPEVMAQILGDPPAAPAAPVSPFALREEMVWCGACLDYDCGDNCYPCSGHVYACAPRCTPICWCDC